MGIIQFVSLFGYGTTYLSASLSAAHDATVVSRPWSHAAAQLILSRTGAGYRNFYGGISIKSVRALDGKGGGDCINQTRPRE